MLQQAISLSHYRQVLERKEHENNEGILLSTSENNSQYLSRQNFHDGSITEEGNTQPSGNNENECFSINNEESEFRDELRTWAIQHQITHTAVNSLLKILKSNFPDNALPVDARTLVRTPHKTTFSTE